MHEKWEGSIDLSTRQIFRKSNFPPVEVTKAKSVAGIISIPFPHFPAEIQRTGPIFLYDYGVILSTFGLRLKFLNLTKKSKIKISVYIQVYIQV